MKPIIVILMVSFAVLADSGRRFRLATNTMTLTNWTVYPPHPSGHRQTDSAKVLSRTTVEVVQGNRTNRFLAETKQIGIMSRGSHWTNFMQYNTK